MKYKIEKDDKFLCIKNFVMEDGCVDYTKGKVYQSDKDGCITDNEESKLHFMNDVEDFFEHFKPI